MTKKNEKAAAAKVRVQAKESVNSEVMVQVAEAFEAMTQAECKKAAGLVLGATMSLNQAIKVFNGLWSVEFKTAKRTYTLQELCAQSGMSKMSVSERRRVWTLKNAKGELMQYRQVSAGVVREGEKPQRVYYQHINPENGAVEWFVLRRIEAQVVERWNARTILQGILQSIFAEKCASDAEKSVKAAEELLKGDVYTFRSQVNKGGINNQAHKLSDAVKAQIMF